MSQATARILTQTQANFLYARGLAVIEGDYGLVTRTAEYAWDTIEQVYEREVEGLCVQHRLGARWEGGRFVSCACDHCERYPEITSNVCVA